MRCEVHVLNDVPSFSHQYRKIQKPCSIKNNCYLLCLWTTSWPYNKTDRNSSLFLHLNQLVLFKHYTCYLNRGEVLSENAVQRMVWKSHECVDLWNAQYVTKLNIVGIQASKKLVKLQKWVKSVPIEKCENLDHIYINLYTIKAICT